MAGHDQGGFEAAIRALWERERAGMMERVATVQRAIEQLRDGSLSEDARAGAHEAAHKIAGAAGSFGFPEATRTAREIEHALRDGVGPSAAGDLAALLAAMREDFAQEPRL